MARIGVSYSAVKNTAQRLLAQGQSPSVQKVRELLGTGSNTTIAQHLKFWREEQATKSVQCVPQNMPKALMSTVDVFWQAAIEQAENQLASVKQSLVERETKLEQAQAINCGLMDDLKVQIQAAIQKQEAQQQTIQDLQSQLAISQERLAEQARSELVRQKQHESRLDNIIDEKHQLLEKIDRLQIELTEHQKKITEQAEQHQAQLGNERNVQEQSEKRWAKLIDQARLETRHLRKETNSIIKSQASKIETLQKTHADLQAQLSAHQASSKNKDESILKLEARLTSLHSEHTLSMVAASKAQARFNHLITSNANERSE